MSQDKAKMIHLIYGIIVSVLIVALGITMMIACWDIYTSGEHPFSRASIGAKLKDMSILLWLNLGAIVGGIILNICLPLQRPKTKAVRDELVLMKKLAAKAGNPTPEQKTAIEKLQRKRWLSPVITGGIFGGLMARPAVYILNRGNFPGADPTGEIKAAALILAAPAIIGLLLCFFCSVFVKKLILKETEIYKQIISSGNKFASVPAADTQKPVLIKTVRFIGFAVAIAFIVVGCFNGSARDVLSKAIKICTECIGLG